MNTVMVGTGQTEGHEAFPSHHKQFTGHRVKSDVTWGVHQTGGTEEILWKFHDAISFGWRSRWMETSTEGVRGREMVIEREKKAGSGWSMGYSEARSGLPTTALTIWLVFSCNFPWGKRGYWEEGIVTRTVVVVTGLYFYLMENSHFYNTTLYRNKFIWEIDFFF